jgi:hypothetical protein
MMEVWNIGIVGLYSSLLKQQILAIIPLFQHSMRAQTILVSMNFRNSR